MSRYRLALDEIVDRLRATRPPADPRRVELPADREWPASWCRDEVSLLPAGVLVPLIDRPLGPTLLLTRRSSALKHHAGQVSFPGGRIEPGDRDILETALRETEEEVGVPRSLVKVVGALPTMPTITGYAVTPLVGIVSGGVRLSLDPGEVDLAFEVPLGFVLDEANERRSERTIEGVSVPLLEFDWGGERIWGATAAMIAELRSLLI
jgi:8-oxo-dGTP pyrophosphatase MutT (NUDIX family)